MKATEHDVDSLLDWQSWASAVRVTTCASAVRVTEGEGVKAVTVMTWELRGPGCIGQSIVVRSFMASAAIRPAIADTRYIQSKVLLRSALCVRHPPRLQHSSMVQAAAAQQNGPSSETATLACGCFWSPVC